MKMKVNDRVFSKHFGYGTITHVGVMNSAYIFLVDRVTVVFDNDKKERHFSSNGTWEVEYNPDWDIASCTEESDSLYMITVVFEHDLYSIEDEDLMEKHGVFGIKRFKKNKNDYGYVLIGIKSNLAEFLAELSDLDVNSEEIVSIMQKAVVY